jgi:probable HAF family extracellular repeat protein
MTLFSAVVLSRPLAAQSKAKQDHPHQYHHYQLIDVGTFGGPQSFLGNNDSNAATVVNQQGTLAGFADTPMPDPFPSFCFGDCYVEHAFQWRKGVRTYLGVLADGVSSAADGGISDRGLIAGHAENGEVDPLIPGFPEIRAVLWENGVIRDLGTLSGGYESYSAAVNNQGQVVGVSENTIPDANSMFLPGYQSRAFLWDKQRGMRDLGTLSGGTDAMGALINEAGQVVGWSYTSSAQSLNCPFPLTTGSFIWDKKHGMTDLGSLGGTCTLAQDLNNRDQVVGSGYLAGDQVSHPFVWDRASGLTDLGKSGGSYSGASAINQNGEVVGGMSLPSDLQIDAILWRKTRGKWQSTDLGTIEGSGCTWGLSINASGQVVGDDCSGNGAFAFLWEEGGSMVDLNTLVLFASGIHINGVITINDRGEIAVSALDANGNSHAVMLIPCDENHTGIESCDYNLVDASAAPQGPAPYVPRTERPPQSRRTNRPHLRDLGASQQN